MTTAGHGGGPRSGAPGSLGPALAGAAALCAAIGLARFAYVPLFPAMVTAGWVGGGEAGLLGALNFAGHLAGALLAPRLARGLGVPRTLDAGMAVVVLAFLGCALHLPDPFGIPWLAGWRFLAGVAGGVVFVTAGPAVQAVTPPERRGRAGGTVTAGVGIGVAATSLVLPLLLGAGGVAGAWLGLAALAAGLWLLARPRWPDPGAAPAARAATGPATGLTTLLAAYTLSAAGMAAPMVYLSDLAARGHGLGIAAGGLVWSLFGLGALAGALTGGRAADRLGGARAVTLWSAVQVAALALALLPHPAGVPPAALLSGFAGVGMSAVALAALRTLVGPATAARWSLATALYAATQAGVGLGLAGLFARTGESHAAVFGVGLLLSVAGLAVSLRPAR